MFSFRAIVLQAFVIAGLALLLSGLSRSAPGQNATPEWGPMIVGRVTAQPGRFVLQGILVELRRYRGPLGSRVLDTEVAYSTKTDEAGEFAFHQVTPGPYSLRATQPGFIDAVIPEFYASESRPFVADVALEVTGGTVIGPPDKLRGKVTTHEGEPVEGASILVFPALDPIKLFRTRSDEAGLFELVPRGSNLVLLVTCPGYKSHVEKVHYDRGGYKPAKVMLENEAGE